MGAVLELAPEVSSGNMGRLDHGGIPTGKLGSGGRKFHNSTKPPTSWWVQREQISLKKNSGISNPKRHQRGRNRESNRQPVR